MTAQVDYNLSEPTEERAIASLERMLGSKEADVLWDRACEAVGFTKPRGPLNRGQLLPVAAYLARQEGFIGVVGVSLQIRLATYDMLYSARPGSGGI